MVNFHHKGQYFVRQTKLLKNVEIKESTLMMNSHYFAPDSSKYSKTMKLKYYSIQFKQYIACAPNDLT